MRPPNGIHFDRIHTKREITRYGADTTDIQAITMLGTQLQRCGFSGWKIGEKKTKKLKLGETKI